MSEPVSDLFITFPFSIYEFEVITALERYDMDSLWMPPSISISNE